MLAPRTGAVLIAVVLAVVIARPAAQDIALAGPSVDFSHGPIVVSKNHRFLEHRDGTSSAPPMRVPLAAAPTPSFTCRPAIPLLCHLGKISGEDVMASWFNPRTGVVKAIGTFVNRSTRQFDPPGEPGRGEDWVLVLDDTGYEYKAPAHRAATVPSR